MRKKSSCDCAEDLEGVILADADRRVGREPLVLALAGLEHVEPADHRNQRGVLDDVHEQAYERREQPPERLRQDHVGVAADPSEAERGRGVALLARDRLHGAACRLRDLRAPPERERDRARVERRELERRRNLREQEERREDRHQDRQAAEDLDVEPDQRRGAGGSGSSAACRGRRRSACSRRRRSRRREACSAAPRAGCSGRPAPSSRAFSAASGSARWRSSRRIPHERLHTSVR